MTDTLLPQRKHDRNPPIGVRLPLHLRVFLDVEADRLGITRTEVIRQAIEDYAWRVKRRKGLFARWRG